MSKPILFSKNQFTLNFAKNKVKYNSYPQAMAVQASDGKILVGGSFINYGGTAGRNRLIRLNSDGTLDTAFCANATDGTKFISQVNAIKLQSDGKILVGGAFTNYAGTTGRNYLIRLNSDGTLDTAFCANATDGTKFNTSIQALAIQSDGKILVGGGFAGYAGTAGRNYLIRLNSDGTLDTTFCANAVDGSKFNSVIFSLAIQSDGKILVGGTFTNYAGTAGRSRLIRLNSNGTLDTAFCANATDGTKFSAVPNSFAIQSDGKILVGGTFSTYAGTAGRNRLIRLNSDGTLDTAFCANATDGTKFNNSIQTLAIQSDGKILVGGTFNTYAGTAGRSYLIRLNSDGTLDTAFCANAVDLGKFNNTVYQAQLQSNGQILVEGSFADYNSTYGRNYLIRLNSDGTLDTAFCANASDSSYNAIDFRSGVVQSDGKILVGGNFLNYGGTAGRSYLIRLNSNGLLDTAFCANATDGSKFNGIVNLLAIQSDGKILVGGAFAGYAGTTGRDYLIRLNSNGLLDTAFCANATDGSKFNNSLQALAIQSDGKILVGGFFTNYAGTAGRSRLIRLNSDGTLDTTFCANAVDGSKFSSLSNSLAIQSDGKILVGGSFANYAGTAGRSYLIRLNSDGTLDTTFCANAVDGSKFSGGVYSVIVQSDGKILVGGTFINYAGTAGRDNLIRLNSDGTLDTAFCANATDGTKFNNSLQALAIQSDGKILVGGSFTSYAGTAGRNYLIRLNSDGTLDTALNSINVFYSYPFKITRLINDDFIIVGNAIHAYGGFARFDKNFNVT